MLVTDTSAPNEKVLLDTLPQPVVSIGNNRHVTYANFAAQEFFGSSLNLLRRQHIVDMASTLARLCRLWLPALDAWLIYMSRRPSSSWEIAMR